MPAQASKSLHGQLYSHIYNRGIASQAIFCDKEDSEAFLGFLKEYLSPSTDSPSKTTFMVRGREYHGVPHRPKNYHGHIELVAYSLLPDHFHLLIKQISEKSLEKLMRSLSTRYSIYFNKKYKRTGPVFDGTYTSLALETDTEVAELIRYLHNNVHQSISSDREYTNKEMSEWLKPGAFDKLTASSEVDYPLLARIAIEKLSLLERIEPEIEAVTTNSESLQNQQPDSLERILLDEEQLERITASVLERIGGKKHRSLDTKVSVGIAILLFVFGFGLGQIRILSTQKPASNVLSVVSSEASPEIAKDPLPTPAPKIWVLVRPVANETKVNIRQNPTTNSKVIGKALPNETFELVNQFEDWYEVKLSDGSVGFISEQYLEVLEQETK
jgi:REP element-mobilizing transposase RayT